jgi:hypothetical protein
VAPTGELATSNINSAQYKGSLLLDTVKSSAGTVSGVQVTTMDTAHVVFVQVANAANAAIASDAGAFGTPTMEYSIPAAAATATNYPGYPLTVNDPVVPKVYFDAGVVYCVSTTAVGCTTTGLDAGAFITQVQYN